jgi:hypothetical protein
VLKRGIAVGDLDDIVGESGGQDLVLIWITTCSSKMNRYAGLNPMLSKD